MWPFPEKFVEEVSEGFFFFIYNETPERRYNILIIDTFWSLIKKKSISLTWTAEDIFITYSLGVKNICPIHTKSLTLSPLFQKKCMSQLCITVSEPPKAIYLYIEWVYLACKAGS